MTQPRTQLGTQAGEPGGASGDPADAEAVRAVLRTVAAPEGGDIVSAGLVEGVQVRDGLVQVTLRAERARLPAMESLARAVEALLGRQPGVRNASVVLTAHRLPGAGPAAAAAAAPAATPGVRGDAAPGAAAVARAIGAAGQGGGPGPGAPAGRPPHAPRPGGAPAALLPEVRAILAVASGKGGVGKSTTAVNLAVALGRQGLRVGLLDADVYGPSLPRMLGASRKPEIVDGTMVPIEAWGLKTMSIGYLVGEETAMVWRGPMVMGALEQMMGQVRWGALDVLVVDMPPGTGDAQLTMAQKVALTGAVIVSTPQDIALLDARRGIQMFEKTHVPVLGIVENMSAFACPNCGHTSHIFGHGGARLEAQRQGVEFLGEIPLLLDIREGADRGLPVVAAAPDSPAALAYTALAARVWEKVVARLDAGGATGPRIVAE